MVQTTNYYMHWLSYWSKKHIIQSTAYSSCAGAIILDAGHKLLGVQDIRFGFNNKVYDSFAIIFNQLYTANGVGTIILDAGDKLFSI